MSDGSDIEMQTALPKKSSKKMPRSPTEDILKKSSDPKRMSTKIMIHDALLQLKNRKGVSLQAIKKYLTEKFDVDTEKINYIIKKIIKNGVEDGSIVQMKGIGASGSFKLVEKKPEKKKKKPADSEKTKKKEKPSEKSKKSKTAVEKSEKTKKSKTIEKAAEKKPIKKTEASKSKMKKPKTNKSMAVNKKDDNKEEKKEENKISKALKTPAKKKAIMMKRKSIGSIIKPPKMKPKVTKAKA